MTKIWGHDVPWQRDPGWTDFLVRARISDPHCRTLFKHHQEVGNEQSEPIFSYLLRCSQTGIHPARVSTLATSARKSCKGPYYSSSLPALKNTSTWISLCYASNTSMNVGLIQDTGANLMRNVLEHRTNVRLSRLLPQ